MLFCRLNNYLSWLLIFSFFTFPILLTAEQSQNSSKTPPVTLKVQKINRYHTGASPAFENYYHDLIDSALRLTTPKFGPHQLDAIVKGYKSDQRVLGGFVANQWHIMFISNLHRDYQLSEHVGIEYHAVFKGLMGLRRLIVHKKNLNRFKKISTLEDLKHIKVGQGDIWKENVIYRAAGIAVVEAKRFENLFPMLIHDQFDALPLSVLEIDKTIQEFSKQYPDLAIVPDLFIYYPVPTYMVTSKSDQSIYQRLEESFSLLFNSNGVDKLLDKHFGVIEMKLNNPNNRTIYLLNPEFSIDQNSRYIEKFKLDLSRF